MSDAKMRGVANALTVCAVMLCVGIGSVVGLSASFVLALCGVPPLGIVAVMAGAMAVGAWCGVRATHPMRDLVVS